MDSPPLWLLIAASIPAVLYRLSDLRFRYYQRQAEEWNARRRAFEALIR